MEKQTRLSNALLVNILGLLLAATLVAGFVISQAEAAKPPTSTTYWLVTGHPDTPVRHQLPSDPSIDFDSNWIVINHADGTQSVFDQNCKVAYLNEATGEWDMVEYYGNDYMVAAESMGGFAPPAMAVSE